MMHLNDPASLIYRFDAFYDIYQSYDAVLPTLEAYMTEIGRQGGPQAADLSRYVGAAWCRIVAADVQHQLPFGSSLIDRSREHALHLADVVASWPLTSLEDEQLLSRYAAARWLDGAAKLLYRLGDHTQARLWDRRALGLVIDTPLESRCRADIASNQIRNLAEELEQVGRKVEQKFEDEIQHAVACLPDALKKIATGDATALRAVRYADAAQRELVRGLCSLFHNWSTNAPEKAMRVAYSKRAELIARALGDKYRIAQAIHNQAILYRDEMPEVSITIWKRLSKNPDWRRGQLMARQNLAALRQTLKSSTAREQLQNCVHGFEGLMRVTNEIQARQRGLANEYPDALDVDLYGYTISEAARSLTNIKGLLGGDDQLPDGRSVRSLDDRLHRELKQMVAAYRSVVKVATYKHAFGKYFDWAYRALISVEVNKAILAGPSERNLAFANAFRWIEEATSRDLLDTAANRVKVPSDGTEPIFNGTSELANEPQNSFPARGDLATEHETIAMTSLRKMRYKASDVEGDIRRQVIEQYLTFEKFSQENPQNAVPIPTDIFEQTSQYSQRHNCVLLRFFAYENHYACLRFRAGQADIVTGIKITRCEEALAVVNKLAENGDLVPYLDAMAELSSAIGEEVLEKLLNFATAGNSPSYPDDNTLVVFIPTGAMMTLPLHIGTCQGVIANVRWPTVYSGSATSLVSKQRFRNCWVEPTPSDRLAAIICDYDQQRFGLEAFGAVDHQFAGRVDYTGTSSLKSQYPFAEHLGETSRDALLACLKGDYEYLAIGAHGQFVSEDDKDQVIHPYLDMTGGSIATPYALACIDPPMQKNNLVLVGACVTAQGANLSGGEISGFYRGLVAAGAGAVAMPFVPVESSFVVPVTQAIIAELMRLEKGPPIFLPDLLRRAFLKSFGNWQDPGYHAASCLFGLFV